jgi:hypothetical protein
MLVWMLVMLMPALIEQTWCRWTVSPCMFYLWRVPPRWAVVDLWGWRGGDLML